MPQVLLTLNGRTHRFDCPEEDQERVREVASLVGAQFDVVLKEFGQVGDDRLLLLTALKVADQLADARQALGQSLAVLPIAGASEAARPAAPAPEARRR